MAFKPEPIYGNMSAYNDSPQNSHSHQAKMPPASSPPQTAQKSVQLAEMHDDLSRLARDNEALRGKLKWTEDRYSQIIGELKAKINKLEEENKFLQNLRSESSPSRYLSPHSMPQFQSQELREAKDEILSMKTMMFTYEEDVGNIKKELEESKRARGILTREVSERAEKSRRQEEEIANLTFLLREYGSNAS